MLTYKLFLESTQPFDCVDCHKEIKVDTKDYYMVHDNIWEEGVQEEERENLLCLDCLEKRLGRKLEIKDFNNYPVNEPIKSELMNEEFIIMRYLKTYFESYDESNDEFNEEIIDNFNEVSEEIIDVIKNIENKTEDIEVAMEKLDFLIEGSGVETINGEEEEDDYWLDTKAIYVNIGDPELKTIFYSVEDEEWYCKTYNEYIND